VEGVIMFEIIPPEPEPTIHWEPVDVGHVQEDLDGKPGVKAQVVLAPTLIEAV